MWAEIFFCSVKFWYGRCITERVRAWCACDAVNICCCCRSIITYRWTLLWSVPAFSKQQRLPQVRFSLINNFNTHSYHWYSACILFVHRQTGTYTGTHHWIRAMRGGSFEVGEWAMLAALTQIIWLCCQPTPTNNYNKISWVESSILFCTNQIGVHATELTNFGTKPILTPTEMEQQYRSVYTKAKPQKEAANKKSNVVRTFISTEYHCCCRDDR